MKHPSTHSKLSESLLLPQSVLPIRGRLPANEPRILERWIDTQLWARYLERSESRPRYILHDGPPYANGHIHLGHAMNKILKDFVNRSRMLLGYRVNYIPGWDCHGLPIEWKIEEQYRARGQDKAQTPLIDFRQQCREFASHWIGEQRREFQRLGVIGNWDDPYITMSPPAEAAIAAEMGKFLHNGSLYQGRKPVLWSIVEQTALAEAEVEYRELTSPMVWVRFPVRKSPNPALASASVLIWTTTAWTFPGNRAVAYGPDIDYGLYRVTACGDNTHVQKQEQLIVAQALSDQVAQALGIRWELMESLRGEDLAKTQLAHPWSELREVKTAFAFDVPLLAADFVTTEQGTGLVHSAPGHGEDDFALCQAHGLENPETVAKDGCFLAHLPVLSGLAVYDANGKPGVGISRCIELLAQSGNLLAKGKLRHAYPHSWRSRAPLIYRNTTQWFISMSGLRDKALGAIAQTTFYPEPGKQRLQSMVQTRPDWCVSRQRAWGVPLPVFLNKQTGEPLRDTQVTANIVKIFSEQGSDAWFALPTRQFLGAQYNPDDYERVDHIVDVWFESGSTHAFVLEAGNHGWPADLYLEGSDQHRGWFQSSLLVAAGTRGAAPYRSVLTHGFALDEQGRKMSKSLGNGIDPNDIIQQRGADILRLWIASSDTTIDIRIGSTILEGVTDSYRKFRNTLRWLSGCIATDPQAQSYTIDNPKDLCPLEQLILSRLYHVTRDVSAAYEQYQFQKAYRILFEFCNVDLSSLYFDIRKDRVYCDALDAVQRRQTIAVLTVVFQQLCRLLAPILCFTAEEAWLALHGDDAAQSVHLETIIALPDAWGQVAVEQQWQQIWRIRQEVTTAIERQRELGQLSSSLTAQVTLPQAARDLLSVAQWEEVLIVSSVAFAGSQVVVGASGASKCERCWRLRDDVTSVSHPETNYQLCLRCRDIVGLQRAS